MKVDRIYPARGGCRQRGMPKLCVDKRSMVPDIKIGPDHYPLDFEGEQPPHEWLNGVGEDEICRHYYARTKDTENRTVRHIYGWLRENLGWVVRSRYW